MCEYKESVTTGQTDAGQSDPYMPLCFAGNTKSQNCSECSLVSTRVFNFQVLDAKASRKTSGLKTLSGAKLAGPLKITKNVKK